MLRLYSPELTAESSWLQKVMVILAVVAPQAPAQDATTGQGDLAMGPPAAPLEDSEPLADVDAPEPDPWADPCPSPRIDQKVLVLSTDGNEADLPAIEQALSTLGTPYTVFETATRDLSAADLKSECNAFYSGVILTNGKLAYDNNGMWQSAFTPEEWDTLANYEKMFGIRQVTWYTFPEPRWGLNYPTSSSDYGDAGYATRYANTAQSPFSSYANTANQLKIANAYTYLAKPLTDPSVMSSNQVSSVTPLLTDASGNALAALTKYDDGRENLALTFDSNQYLTHAQVLSYGLVNWVTKGMFLGERHVYMDPQPDDIFATSGTWGGNVAPAAVPCDANLDDPNWSYGQYRITRSDVNRLVTWQKAKRAQPTTAQLRITMPFNGAYATSDGLRTALDNNQKEFKWLNHTWTHTSWDDADDNPLNGIGPGLTYSAAKLEVTRNNTFASNRGYAPSRYRQTNLVTPGISGLGRRLADGSSIPPNGAALQAAYDTGVRYTAGDASRAGIDQPVTDFNEGWYTTASEAGYTPPAGSQPYSILVYPRHTTNLFFNVSTPEQWVAEYNCMYRSFWGKDLSYNEILDKESDMLLSYLLKGSVDPLMFHQANLRAYSNGKSLMGDLLDATFAKYNALFKLPILSPTVDEVGQKMAERMAYDSAGVTASVGPDQNGVQSITLTAQKAAKVPVTGLGPRTASSPVAYTTESYGGQSISYVSLSAGQSVTIPLQ
jgi:hypothetical protein